MRCSVPVGFALSLPLRPPYPTAMAGPAPGWRPNGSSWCCAVGFAFVKPTACQVSPQERSGELKGRRGFGIRRLAESCFWPSVARQATSLSGSRPVLR